MSYTPSLNTRWWFSWVTLTRPSKDTLAFSPAVTTYP